MLLVLLLLTSCLLLLLLLPLWESVIVLCFVVRYFMFILVLQSSWWGRESYLSSWCLVMVERLFLAVPRECLRFVIVVFPDHTHLLFLMWNHCIAMRLELHFAHKCTLFARIGRAKQPVYTCWICFAPVFSFMYLFALSPFYIFVYMF